MTEPPPPTPAQRRPARALLALAVVSGVLLMSPLLSGGPLVLDEHCSYWMIDSDLPGTTLDRSLNYAAIPPLSSWLQSAFLSLFGKTEFVFRLPSALCFLAAIFVCYAAGRDLWNAPTGGVAALLVAWHPEAMDEVRIARCYGLVLLLGSLVLWTAIRWARTPRSLGWALGWSLSGAALMWTHYTGGPLVFVSGMAVAVSSIRQRALDFATVMRLGLAAALLVTLCIPLVPAVWRLTQWGTYLNYSPPATSVWHTIGPLWWAGLPAGFLASGIFSRGKLSAPPRPALWLAAACSLLPLLAIAALSSGELSSVANPRYRVAYAPAAACFIALLIASARRWPAAAAGAAAALAVAWTLSGAVPWEPGRLGSPADREWRDLNAHVAAHAQEGEPLLVQSGLAEAYLVPAYFKDPVFMEYVACRISRFYVETRHPRYALPFVWNPRSGVVEFYQSLLDSWDASPAAHAPRSSPPPTHQQRQQASDANPQRKPGSQTSPPGNQPDTFWVASATDTDLNRNSLAGIQALAESAGFEAIEHRTWPNATLIHYRRQ